MCREIRRSSSAFVLASGSPDAQLAIRCLRKTSSSALARRSLSLSVKAVCSNERLHSALLVRRKGHISTIDNLRLDFSRRLGLNALMARALRIERPGGRYHVTSRGNAQKAIYRDDPDRAHCLEFLGEATERFGIRVHAYVLMDNHYHLLIHPRSAQYGRARKANSYQ